jgi:DNA-directed RNA polymerase I, II, and III subunit RPABC1
MSEQTDFQEKKEWFNVRKTVIEMLQDRGHVIPEDVSIVNFEQFSIKYDTDNIDIYINDETKNKKIYIHFNINLNKKFGKSDLVETLKKVVGTYKDENINLILLLREKENSTVTKELEKKQYENVEIFLKKNMIFNITHHVYVPKHIVLNETESEEIVSKFNTPKIKFPKILKTDPVARYFALKSGMMCKILRKSPEVGESVSYRYCI